MWWTSSWVRLLDFTVVQQTVIDTHHEEDRSTKLKKLVVSVLFEHIKGMLSRRGGGTSSKDNHGLHMGEK